MKNFYLLLISTTLLLSSCGENTNTENLNSTNGSGVEMMATTGAIETTTGAIEISTGALETTTGAIETLTGATTTGAIETTTGTTTGAEIITTGATTTGTSSFVGKELDLARCLSEKGFVFYGTEWCSHCNAQKSLFGTEAMKIINFVDCDKDTKKCLDAGITGYPTLMVNGQKMEGETSLEIVSQAAGCNL